MEYTLSSTTVQKNATYHDLIKCITSYIHDRYAEKVACIFDDPNLRDDIVHCRLDSIDIVQEVCRDNAISVYTHTATDNFYNPPGYITPDYSGLRDYTLIRGTSSRIMLTLKFADCGLIVYYYDEGPKCRVINYDQFAEPLESKYFVQAQLQMLGISIICGTDYNWIHNDKLRMLDAKMDNANIGYIITGPLELSSSYTTLTLALEGDTIVYSGEGNGSYVEALLSQYGSAMRRKYGGCKIVTLNNPNYGSGGMDSINGYVDSSYKASIHVVPYGEETIIG